MAYKVITSMRVPDHSTVAEFRRRRELEIGDLFDEVLGLCREAGLLSVGVITIDGTKIKANASMDQNRSYRELVTQILREAEETDRREDELCGDARGDELPEQLRTPEGRKAALADAKRRLAERKGRAMREEVPHLPPARRDPQRRMDRPTSRPAGHHRVRPKPTTAARANRAHARLEAHTPTSQKIGPAGPMRSCLRTVIMRSRLRA